MPFLRQSTSQVILFGPCLDKTDGVTEETALTLAQADMRLSKDGGAFAQKSAAGNATHDSDGWYSTTLSTTDTATVGELRLNVHQPANMLPVWDRWWVIEEAVYDSMFGASAGGPLQPTTAGRTLDVTATGAAGIDWANVENPTTALDLSGTDIQLADTVTTNTDMLTAAEVNAEVDTALTDIHLDHLLAVDYDPATPPGTSTALFNELIESNAGVSRYTVGALANAPSGTGASAATIADAVWDEAQADHVAAGSFGITASEIAAIPTTAMRGTDNAALATDLTTVDTVVDGIQTDLSNATDGLGALKALIDTVNTDLSNGTDGLGALKALIDTVDTVADAIKVVTDNFAFTVANQVDSNIQSVNDVTVTGTGATGSEWGP